MEIIMSTDLQQILPQAIHFNYQELKTELSQKLEKYNNLVVTEDDIKSSKTDRAGLNKLKEALVNERIEVKKNYLMPYEAFAAKINELIVLIDEPIQSIDRQLKAFEQIKKDEKKSEIQQLYLDEIGDLKELIPLNKIWNDRWLNATFKIADVAAEIEAITTKVTDGLKIIEKIESEFTQQIKDKFFDTLDISKAIAEDERLKALKAKQEKYNSLQVKTEIPVQAKKEPPVTQRADPATNNPSQAVQNEPLTSIDFRVWVNSEQKQALKQFLVDNQIKYGRVPACQTTA